VSFRVSTPRRSAAARPAPVADPWHQADEWRNVTTRLRRRQGSNRVPQIDATSLQGAASACNVVGPRESVPRDVLEGSDHIVLFDELDQRVEAEEARHRVVRGSC